MALETCFGDMTIAEALQSAELLATEVMPHFADTAPARACQSNVDEHAGRLRSVAAVCTRRGREPSVCRTARHREWLAVRHWGVTRQALLLDVKEALVDEFVDAEGA